MNIAKASTKTIDDYIKSFPTDVQSILQTLRHTIREEAPDAVETISYQMPTFKLNGKFLVYFAAWKDHISLYPATSSMEVSDQEIIRYRTGKGTFQFPIDKTLPLSVIREIVKIRVKENLQKKS